jgi:hypothetical protein
MRGLWVSVIAVLFLGPTVTSASADERAELQRLRGTVLALEGRIRRLEAQVRRLEGRLAQAMDREKPTDDVKDDDLKSAILKAMYRLADRAAVASEDAELMRALADLYAKLDKARPDAARSRRGRAPTSPPPGTSPPEAGTHRPQAMLGVALDADGTVIRVLPETPAEEAGIQGGDVIQRIDGREIDKAMDIVRIIAKKKPGQAVTIELLRGEEKTQVKAVLARRPDG